MPFATLLLASAYSLSPLAVWSGSDTGLGQKLRAAFEKAIVESGRFSPVVAPQGDAPSLLVDEVQSPDGMIANYKLTLFRGEPDSSAVIWEYSGSCPMAELDRCALAAIALVPDEGGD